MARLGAFAAALALVLASAPAQSEGRAEFRNLNRSYHLELPTGWRQLAPNEARRIGELPGAPRDLKYVEPRSFYAVGPVDAWLAGDFSSPWLWVVEQGNEWEIEADYAERLHEMWRSRGEAEGVRYELADISQSQVGTQNRLSVVAVRTATPLDGNVAAVTRSLDVHAPSGGQQLSFSFVCRAEAWPTWEPRFREWLGTLTFARMAREEATIGDRLWSPILTGAAVGIVLLILYKRSKRRS